MISEVEQERRKGTFIPIFFLLYIYTKVLFGQFFFENDPLDKPNQMPLSKKLYLFGKLAKNAKWWSKSNLPLSHSSDRKIFPFKKGFKKTFLIPQWPRPFPSLKNILFFQEGRRDFGFVLKLNGKTTAIEFWILLISARY